MKNETLRFWARRKKVIILLVAMAFTLTTKGQVPISSWWETDGELKTIVSDETYTYIGGDFSHVFPRTGAGAIVDITTGRVTLGMPRVTGRIDVAIPDGSGGLYIGGDFSVSEGVTTVYHLAHIRPDKTLNPDFLPNPNNSVLCMVKDGDFLYVGGDYSLKLEDECVTILPDLT